MSGDDNRRWLQIKNTYQPSLQFSTWDLEFGGLSLGSDTGVDPFK